MSIPRTLASLMLRLALMWSFGLLLQPLDALAQPRLEVQQGANSSVNLSWPSSDPAYTLETTARLHPGSAWEPVPAARLVANDRFTITVPAGDQTRFFRLRRTSAAALTVVAETSPVHGESGVAVTRETILRFSAPLASDAILTGDHLFAEFAGRKLLARTELASDRRTLTLFYLENLPASSRVRVTFSPANLRDSSNRPLDADGDGQPGGSRVLEFNTSGITGIANTAVIGRVFASEKNPDGSNKPLENVTVTVDGAEETLRTVTDARGAFSLSPSPAGRFFVHVDGRTAVGSKWPTGAYYPFVGKAWEASAGQTNNLAGGSGEIFLPLIQSDALQTVSVTEETRVTFAPSVLTANPALMGVEIVVPANSIFSDNGTRGGKVGLAPVLPDRLPEPLPPGLNMPLVITVQTDGGSNFDVPVPVKFPNLPDPVTAVKLPPGAKTALWSFNHDTGRWEIQGTMTISADGSFAVTDPGVGIRQPGWHGVAGGSRGWGPRSRGGTAGNPGSPGIPDDDCEGDECRCTQVIKCVFPKEGKSAALCALDCLGNVIDDIFGDGEKPERTAFETGLRCIGGPDKCPGRPDETLNKRRRLCMSSCISPDPDVEEFTMPCEGFEHPCSGGDSLQLHGAAAIDFPASVLPDRLREQLEFWDLEEDFLIRLTGTSKILDSESSEVSRISEMFDALADRVRPSSAAGIHLSADERTEMLALPRPAQFSLAEWTAMIDRLDSLQGVPPPADVAEADRLLNELTGELRRRGWQYRADGLLHGLARQSRNRSPELGSELFPSRAHYYYLKNHRTGFVQRGRLNTGGQFDGLILAPEGYYTVAYVDPVTLHAGAAFFQAHGVGNPTLLPTAPLLEVAATEQDSDADGLSDAVEKILGTSSVHRDTDGDGMPDGVELLNGTNPSDNTPTTIGVIANTDTPGSARGLVVLDNYAFVADSNAGLAVLQLNGFSAPILVASVPLAQSATAIAGSGNVVALATGSSVTGLDVRVPDSPVKLWQVEVGAQVRAVSSQANQVAAAVDGDVVILHGVDGSVQQRLTGYGTHLHDVQLDGNRMFALSADQLLAFQFVDSQWEFVSSVPARTATNPIDSKPTLLIDGNIARVGVATGPGTGIISLDVSLLSGMQMLRQGGPNFPSIHELASTGSGRIAAITATGQRAVTLYEASDPLQVPRFVSSFLTRGVVQQTTVHAGLMLAADGDAGLTLINFLEPDRGTNAPAVTIHVADANENALRRFEFGSQVVVEVQARDDVGIRSVEVELDGSLVASGGSAPFRALLRMPDRSAGRTTVTLRGRATDLAGHSAWSAPFTASLVEDASVPGILSVSPPRGAVILPGTERHVAVTFGEAIASAVSAGSLTVTQSGADGNFATPDDVAVPGSVSYDAANRTIVFTANAPLGAGKYQATLAAGIGDVAGNSRARSFVWTFQDAPLARLIILPPAKTVDVGGVLAHISVGFDRALSQSVRSGLTWKLVRKTDGTAPQTEVAPLDIRGEATGTIFTILFPSPLATGEYRLSASGTGITAVNYDFSFRNVPNEWVLHESGDGTWKYSPGPIPGDSVVINAPGRQAVIESGEFKSIIAYTDLRLGGGTGGRIEVLEPMRIHADLELFGTRFGPGETHVRGLLAFRSAGDFNPIVIGPHTLNAYGGGYMRTGRIAFSDPNGALVNHPGSVFVLSNNTAIANTGIAWSNAGHIINLGTVRAQGGTNRNDQPIRLEDVRLRNDGRIEVITGGLKVNSFENEGTTDLTVGARLLLPLRFRSGVSSRLTGNGTIEFGEYNASTRRVVASADAEIKGEIDPVLRLTLVAGHLTLFKPLIRPAGGVIELQNSGNLTLMAPAHIGTLSMTDGDLVCNSDTTIDTLSIGQRAEIRSATLVRITGEARIQQGIDALGSGVVEFAGTTTLSNGTQSAAAYVGNATFRNTGTWRHSVNSSQGGVIATVNENGQPGMGAFENAGLFEQTTPRTLGIQVPFRNSGQLVLARATVEFDANPAPLVPRRGAYLPLPGGELVLNETTVRYNSAGTLDLAAGILRGVGSIQAVGVSAPVPRVVNRAIIRPGLPIGDLVIRATGGFEQTPSGELIFTLAESGNSSLRLDNTAATLAGTLAIELSDAFSPVLGRTFTVMTFIRRTGEFTSLKLPALGAGKKLEVVYGPGAVTVRVVTE